MIQEDYVSFEVAKLLKEKGFEECPLFRYDDCGYLWVQGGYNKTIKWHFPAPTLQMAIKWLRNQQIFIRPNASFLYPIKWYSEIFCYGDNFKTQQDVKTEYYDSPEEATEKAIEYCLENLI